MSRPPEALDDKITLTGEDINNTLRRVASHSIEIAADELRRQVLVNPHAENDPGREWAVRWLRELSTRLAAGEGKDHDARA